MKGSMRAATAIGVGYLLGRRRKLRTAVLMAAGTAAGGAAAGGALRQGMKKAGSGGDVLGKVSPELGEVTKTLRGELINAGKAAATAAVNNQVNTLAESLHQRAERLRDPGATARGDKPDNESDNQSRDQRDDQRDEQDELDDQNDRYEDEVDDRYEDDEVDEPDDYEDDDLADEEDAGGQRDDEGEADEEVGEEDRRPARSRGGTATRAPVTRARR